MSLSITQKEVINSLINPMVRTLADLFPNNGNSQRVRGILWKMMEGGGAWVNICKQLCLDDKKVLRTLSDEAIVEMVDFSAIFSGHKDIFRNLTMGGQRPTIGEVRVALFSSMLNALHKAYPNDPGFPLLSVIDQNIQGMERIRALFLQYATLTMSGSIERYMLALEIILEKEKLNIPSFMSSNDHIYTNGQGYAPGDFSGLDLSKMIIERDTRFDHGNFKGWHLKNSKFDGTSFINICLYGANFERSSLKGVDFTRCHEMSLVLIDADINGMYAGNDYIPPRNARNHALISKSEAELAQFRLDTGSGSKTQTLFWSQESTDLSIRRSREEAIEITRQAMQRAEEMQTKLNQALEQKCKVLKTFLVDMVAKQNYVFEQLDDQTKASIRTFNSEPQNNDALDSRIINALVKTSAINEAAAKGHLDMLKLLVQAGADVNSGKKDRKFTPLMRAAEEGHAEIVDFLMEKGADIGFSVFCGAGEAFVIYDAQALAVKNGHKNVIETLFIKPFCEAAMQSEPKMLNDLLLKYNFLPKNDYTSLNNQDAVCKYLLKKVALETDHDDKIALLELALPDSSGKYKNALSAYMDIPGWFGRRPALNEIREMHKRLHPNNAPAQTWTLMYAYPSTSANNAQTDSNMKNSNRENGTKNSLP
ncbi:MAG: ankyrin repeat domain-containing protein [Gammaproteobacteria bacterium]